MFKKILNFIQYNNLMVFIILAVFLLSTGVFAQTEIGQAVIGQKQTSVQGTDNTLLLAADLDKLDMDYKIENIEEDDSYYYVKYTFIDLVLAKNSWQYQLQEKTKKVSKKSRVDLGVYLAQELSEEYAARVKDLKEQKSQALLGGKEQRTEVTAYTGLIGQALDLTGWVFPGYEPIKTNVLPSPEPLLPLLNDNPAATPDDLTALYKQYITEHPDLSVPVVPPAATSSEPIAEEPAPVEASTTEESFGSEPESVEIIDLPPAETPFTEEDAPADTPVQ